MGAVPIDQRGPMGPLSAGAKLGRYEVLAKLAAGGMAVVYVARAHGVAGFERLVAVKVLHANLAHEEEFIKMFLDEARLAARIRHPNVVPTIDISDSEEAGYFIVMDYIEGDHLGQILSSAHKDNERLPVPVTLRIVVDALGGLGAAHDLIDENGKHLGLVHRDVSPHNIMVGRDGVARLTDFGVAKAEDRLTHTRDGQVKGKLAYMAPEQASSGKTDSRSDLFSMGVILWECITGRRLFRTESTAATLNKLMNEDAPAPSTVDPALAPLDGVLAKALSRDPEKRFRTAEEFAQAIEDAATGVGGLSSLRAVGKAVKQYAAAKLRRDKKLIDDAVLALKPVEGEPSAFALDSISEPSGVSSSDVSVGSLSMSKVSGVFAHATNPGAQPGAVRAQPGAPVPPPPLGDIPSMMPDALELDVPVDLTSRKPQPKGRGGLLLLLLLGACALGAVYWLSLERDTVRVQQIEHTPAPVAQPAPAQPPAPAVAPVAEKAVTVEAVPVAAPEKSVPAAARTPASKTGSGTPAGTASGAKGQGSAAPSGKGTSTARSKPAAKRPAATTAKAGTTAPTTSKPPVVVKPPVVKPPDPPKKPQVVEPGGFDNPYRSR